MDKFRNLQIQITNIIERLENQIEEKQKIVSRRENEAVELKYKIGNLEKKINEIRGRKSFQESIMSQSTLTYLIKKNIKEDRAYIRELIKAKRWFCLILQNGFVLLICGFIAYMIILYPALLAILPFVFLISLFPNLKEIISLRRLKKNNPISSINEELLNAENTLAQLKEKGSELKVEIEQLKSEINSLQFEKSYYEEELNRIINARENAIEQLAIPILDEAYRQVDTSEVISRIRAKEKKEGEE